MKITMLKKVAKKMLCLITVCSVFFSIFSVSQSFLHADDNLLIPDNCDTLIDVSGIEHSIGDGETYNDLYTNVHKKIDKFNLTNAEYIEFDLYISDKELLSADTNKYSLLFCVSSASGRAKHYNTKIAGAAIESQITTSGWNHIKIVVSDLSAVKDYSKVDDSTYTLPDFGSLTHYFLRFDIDSKLAMTSSGLKIEVKNFCTTYGVPSQELGTESISNAHIDKYLGSKVTDKYSDIKDRYSNILEKPIDLSEADIFKADIRMKDFPDFINTLKNNQVSINLVFSSSGDFDSNIAIADITNYFKLGDMTDWYKLIVIKSKFVEYGIEWSKVCAWAITFTGIGVDSTLGEDYQKRIAVTNLSATKVVDATVSEFAIATYDGESKLTEFTNNLSFPVTYSATGDITLAQSLKVSIYITDVSAIRDNTKLTLVTTNGNQDIDIKKYLIRDGWNDIEIDTKEISIDLSLITTFNVSSDNTLLFVELAGICANYVEIPERYAENADEIKAVFLEEHHDAKWGSLYNNALNQMDVNNVDFSGCDFIEFDIYIQDYVSFKYALTSDADGNEVEADLRLRLSSSKDNAYTLFGQFEGIEKQIKKSGWNHIFLNKKSAYTEGVEWSEIRSWMVYLEGAAGKSNPLKGQRVMIANIIGTVMVLPEKPENVIVELGTQDGDTIGNDFHWTMDRIFEEKLSPIDFTDVTTVQFDAYISDYETFKYALDNSVLGVKLAMCLSSTPVELWPQYEKPRMFYRADCDFTDQITKSGWNHISIPRESFINGYNKNIDWQGVTGWCLQFLNTSNFNVETNLYAREVYINIANVVGCSVLSQLPADNDKPAKPDENAVYISDAETLVDNYGTWNPSTVIVSKKYKSEGKGSIANKITFATDINDANIKYLFDGFVNMGDLKTIKFDLFVDLPQFFCKSGNKAKVILAADRSGSNNYYYWNLDIMGMQEGWNELSFEISKAEIVGEPKLEKMKSFIVKFTDVDLNAEEFENFTMNVDNLRYISKTGNKNLNVVGESNDLIDDEQNENVEILPDTDSFEEPIIDTDSFEEPIIDTESEDADKGNIAENKADVKIVKNEKNKVIDDYLMAGVILGIEAAILAIGVVLFIILHKKRNKAK